MGPKFSIITINLNNASGLKKTIKSVIDQTFSDFEYIVVDGGSKDGSADSIKEFNEKITYYISEKDNGIYNAMNKGIANSKGEYLLFLNSGDYLSNRTVLNEAFSLSGGTEDVIYGDFQRSFPDGKTDFIRMPDEINSEYLLKKSLAHPATFLRRELFYKYGFFDETYKIAADHAFFVRLFLMTSLKYKHINLTISNFSMDGISSKPGSFLQINEERSRAFSENLPPEYLRLINEYYKILKIHNRLKVKLVYSVLQRVKKFFFKFSILINNLIRNKLTYKVFNPFKVNSFEIPIIINNRNRVKYLKRLIFSLEKRGYKNIQIIDNKSDYPRLLEFYKATKYKVHYLDFNGGYCALWDSFLFKKFFKDTYYIYTDSDIELAEECPVDVIDFMLFNLWRHKAVDKIGLSLSISDLPEHFREKDLVITRESSYWSKKYDKNLFDAKVDTTFALYRKNKFGPSGFIKAVRTRPPYTAKHLPWYENSLLENEENLYYTTHCETRTRWTKPNPILDGS